MKQKVTKAQWEGTKQNECFQNPPTIGEMIAYLDDDIVSLDYHNDRWEVICGVGGRCPGLMYIPDVELCDALWFVCKQKMEVCLQ